MAQRYGRNQKRKHRITIELLMEACAAHEHNRLYAEHKFQRLEAEVTCWDERIGELLGRYSVLRREVEPMLCSRIDEVRRIHEPPGRLYARAFDPNAMPECVTIRPIDLIHLLMRVSDEDLIHMRRYVALRLVNASNPNEWRLAISAELLHAAIHDRRMMCDLANDIVGRLGDAMRSRKAA